MEAPGAEVQTVPSSPPNNNLVRSDIESTQIKTLDSDREQDLGRLEVKLARATYKASIHKLPPEILGEIFLLCIDDISTTWLSRIPPLLLCQICSFWRTVALEHPALWNNIRLWLGPGNEALRYNILQIWLDRAKSLPLDIGIRAYTRTTTIPIPILTPYLPRTRNLSLCLPSNLLVSILATNIPSISMPFLEELELAAFPAEEFVPLILGVPSIFKHTPRLRSVSIASSETRPLEIHKLELPFSQITQLSIKDVHLADNIAAVLFQQLVNLEELKLEVRSWDQEEVSDALFPIVIPKLRCLDVTVGIPAGLNRVFEMLTLPLLDHLRISLFEALFVDFSEFYNLQMRSSFKLSRLSLCYVLFRPGFFETLLRANPSLTDLSILHAWFLRDIRVLEYSPEDISPILPRLQDLLIHKTLGITDDQLVRIVVSRWWPASESTFSGSLPRISRLRSVSICADEDDQTSGDLAPDALEALDRCRKEGLDLKILTLDIFDW